MNSAENSHDAVAEVRSLAEAVCAGSITPEGCERLNALLLDERAALTYALYVRMHGLLCWHWQDQIGAIETPEAESARHAAGESPAGLASTGSSAPVVIDLDPSLSTPRAPFLATFIGGPVFSYMVATVILGVMLLSAWAYKISRYDCDSVVDNSRGLTAPGDSVPKTPELVFVGRVTGMKDCRWADPRTETYLGASVSLNRKYALSSGLLEIAYKTGAKVILEGPCTYEIESDAGGFLALGKLTARVDVAKPQAAKPQDPRPKTQDQNPQSIPHPSSLFSVRTPTAVVTDLGTEFGVEVGENGYTTSHVFRGAVRVEAGGEESVVLRENESVRVEKDGRVRETHHATGENTELVRFTHPTTTPKFVRRIEMRRNALDLTHGDYVGIFQDDFDGGSLDAGKWVVTDSEGDSVSVAEGLATIRSKLDPADGVAYLHSAKLDFSVSPDDWWAEIKFKMDGDLISGFSTVRDWIVLTGVSASSGDWETQGFDLRAMQRGTAGNAAFDLGWLGWDNVHNVRAPVALARNLEKGRFYAVTIHRKPDDMVDVFLDGRLIAVRPLAASKNPLLLHCGDVSKLVGGTQVVDYVKVVAKKAGKSASNTENRKEEPTMDH